MGLYVSGICESFICDTMKPLEWVSGGHKSNIQLKAQGSGNQTRPFDVPLNSLEIRIQQADWHQKKKQKWKASQIPSQLTSV